MALRGSGPSAASAATSNHGHSSSISPSRTASADAGSGAASSSLAPPPSASASSTASSTASLPTPSLQTLMQTEEAGLRTAEWTALKTTQPGAFQNSIWREKVVQWFYDLVDHLGERRDVVYVAINILDKYLAVTQCGDHLDQWRYKRTSISALFLTIRLVGKQNVDLPRLLQLTGAGDVTVQDVLSTGKLMLQSMSWEHRILTPTHFVRSLLTMLQPDLDMTELVNILECAMYLTELESFDTYFLAWPPSCLGGIAVMQAIEQSIRSQSRQDALQARVAAELNGYIAQNSSCVKVLESAVARLRSLYRQSAEHTTTKDSSGPNVIPIMEEDYSVNDGAAGRT